VGRGEGLLKAATASSGDLSTFSRLWSRERCAGRRKHLTSRDLDYGPMDQRLRSPRLAGWGQWMLGVISTDGPFVSSRREISEDPSDERCPYDLYHLSR
jgi:hypothetical protein